MNDPTTTGVINEVFQNNLDVIVQNFGQIQGTSSRLLLGLATIEFLLFLYGSYKARSEEVIAKAIEKLFLIFVVALLTFNWGAVAGWMRGYIGGGGAGVGGGNSMITSMNPAYVASDGLDKVSVIFSPEGQRAMMDGNFFNDPEAAKRKREREAARKKREDQNLFERATGLDKDSMIEGFLDAGADMARVVVVGLIFCGLGLLIVFVHFYVALQLFVLTIDWYLTVAMTNLLIPFAVNKHTSSLASAGFQAVVRKSVQLGVMMAVLGMFGNTIQGLGLGPQPTMIDVLSLLLGSLTMAFMVKNIPQIASSIFAGGGGTVDVGGTLQAAAASMASRTAAAMSGGASFAGGAAAGAGFEVGRKGAQLAGKGAQYAGGKAMAMGRAGMEGAASLGGRARDFMDAAKGGRDAEPKSLEELHKMQLEESSRVSNQVEQNSLGAMKIDEQGNVQGAQTPSVEDEAYRGGLDAREGLPAVRGYQAVPQTQQMHGVEAHGNEAPDASIEPVHMPSSSEQAPQAPESTQAMYGVGAASDTPSSSSPQDRQDVSSSSSPTPSHKNQDDDNKE